MQGVTQDSDASFIEFEKVVAGPPGSKTALFNDLSFKLNPGDSTVIVGESGAGKSSVRNVYLQT